MIGSKEKNHDWKSRLYLWIKSSVVAHFKYLVAASIFVFVFAFAFTLFFQSCYLSHTNVNSARYMLSALVQSEAAIVAIIITLTLIAVQLTASAYSPRVVDIFRENLSMWILLGLYGTSIFYGLIVLRLIEGNKGKFVSESIIWSLGHLSISLEWCVSIAFWLGIITYVALFPYILNIINLLKPENIIKQLASDINGRKFIYSHLLCWDNVSGNDSRILRRFLMVDLGLGWAKNAEIPKPDDKKIHIVKGENSVEIKITKEEKKATLTISGGGTYDLKVKDKNGKLNIYFNLNEDPIQPIVDIIRGSIRKYDFETTRVGLEALTNQVIKVVDSDCKEEISNSFCSRLQGVGKLAASVMDEDSTIEVIENFKKFSENTVKKKLGVATEQAITSLEVVGIAATRKGTELDDAVKKTAESLEAVGKTAVENDLIDATKEATKSLGAVGVAAAKKKLEDAAGGAISSLEIVGKIAVEKEQREITLKIVLSLQVIGTTANAGEEVIKQAVLAIRNVSEDAKKKANKEKEFEAVIERSVRAIEKIEESAAGKVSDEVMKQIKLRLRLLKQWQGNLKM